jgi:hypothetical protein
MKKLLKMLRNIVSYLAKHLSQFSPARRDEATEAILVPSPGRRGLGRGVSGIIVGIILFSPASAFL